MKGLHQKIMKDPKWAVVTVLLIVIVILLIVIPNAGSKVEFKIQDKCGQFVNVFSHTIPDKDTCQRRCRSQCISSDYEFVKVDFTESNQGCHTCRCFCK